MLNNGVMTGYEAYIPLASETTLEEAIGRLDEHPAIF